MCVCVARYAPEGLALHVLICQTVVGETLVPHGVAGVSQGLCAQLGRLSGAGSDECKETRNSQHTRCVSYHLVIKIHLAPLPIKASD